MEKKKKERKSLYNNTSKFLLLRIRCDKSQRLSSTCLIVLKLQQRSEVTNYHMTCTSLKHWIELMCPKFRVWKLHILAIDTCKNIINKAKEGGHSLLYAFRVQPAFTADYQRRLEHWQIQFVKMSDLIRQACQIQIVNTSLLINSTICTETIKHKICSTTLCCIKQAFQ